MFDVRSNLFDAFAGHETIPLRLELGVTMQDVARVAAPDLVQSAWRLSTRVLYQGWLVLWLAFCTACDVAPLPADPSVLVEFMTELVLSGRNASTIGIAVAAVIGFHRLNNMSSPFYMHPVTRLAWKGIDKTRHGSKVRPKDGVDPEFIRRMWRHFHALWHRGDLLFRDARAWFCIQLGWEIGARPGELHFMSMCDVVPVRWLGESACADLMIFVRGAKNDPSFQGQCTRVVMPDVGDKVCVWCGEVVARLQTICEACVKFSVEVSKTEKWSGDKTIGVKYPFSGCPCPSAAWLFHHMWFPALLVNGFTKSRKCMCAHGPSDHVCVCRLMSKSEGCPMTRGARTDILRTYRCEICFPLLPTRPRCLDLSRAFPNAVSTQTIGEDVRRVAGYIDVTGLDLSAKSLRIGGLSAATEDADGPGMEQVSAEMRWRSKKVPQNVYKRKTSEEQRRTGLALHAAVRARQSTASVTHGRLSLESWLEGM